jgi:hypothetical protein
MITKLLKEGCISLVSRGRLFQIAQWHDRRRCGWALFNLKNKNLQNEIWSTYTNPPKPNSLKK